MSARCGRTRAGAGAGSRGRDGTGCPRAHPRSGASDAPYSRERPHRGLALLPPETAIAAAPPPAGKIERREQLGGLIHEYYRAAA